MRNELNAQICFDVKCNLVVDLNFMLNKIQRRNKGKVALSSLLYFPGKLFVFPPKSTSKEHLQKAPPKLKEIYILKIQKKKIKLFFHIWLDFVTQGGNFKQYNINIFCLTNKITFKTYDIMEYK